MEIMKSEYILTEKDMCLNKQLLCVKAGEYCGYTKGNVYHISWVGSHKDMVTLSSDDRPVTWLTRSLINIDKITNWIIRPIIFINAHKFSDESIFLYKLSGNLEDLMKGLSDVLDIDN